MSDYVYVNILNEGSIPWIRERGPIFGYHMPTSVYQLLSRDPRMKMELTDFSTMEAKKQAYLNSKKKVEEVKPIVVEEPKKEKNKYVEEINQLVELDIPEIPKEMINEALTIKQPVDSVDDELDAILDEIPDTKSNINSVINDENENKEEFVVYSARQLNKMTKGELKKILLDRGYTKGPYAPKYHDHVEDLIKKVKNTQK